MSPDEKKAWIFAILAGAGVLGSGALWLAGFWYLAAPAVLLGGFSGVFAGSYRAVVRASQVGAAS